MKKSELKRIIRTEIKKLYEAKSPKDLAVGDNIKFYTWVPDQNIGKKMQTNSGKIIKINQQTIVIKDKSGNTVKIDKEQIVK